MRQLGARGLAVVAAQFCPSSRSLASARKTRTGATCGPNGPAEVGQHGKELRRASRPEPVSDRYPGRQRPERRPGVAAVRVQSPSPLKIIDNGHSIQVNYMPGQLRHGRRKGVRAGVQFHFHKPSEEKIDGKVHDMVAHLVHRGPGGQARRHRRPARHRRGTRLIKTLWDNLPKEKGKGERRRCGKDQRGGPPPGEQGLLHFAGSLTTPPCSEDVTWFVLKTPVQVSADQIARFAKSYPMNAAPRPALNDRDIQANAVGEVRERRCAAIVNLSVRRSLCSLNLRPAHVTERRKSSGSVFNDHNLSVRCSLCFA